jgi:peptidyl-prolyl cis-trans isomerase A (cyclophilin A)
MPRSSLARFASALGFAAIPAFVLMTANPAFAEGGPPAKKADKAEKADKAKPAAAGKKFLPAAATAKAPAVFKVKFTTTKGDFVVEVHKDWAPLGAERFYNLAKHGYFTDIAFFRVIKGFMVQFGIHGDPEMNKAWHDAKINDDPAGKHSNTRGMITFATAGPNTRTTQLFINYVDNVSLDNMGFAPFGKVLSGMDVVDKIEGQYGEGAPGGRGPSQGTLQDQGNAYLKAQFPALDYIKSAKVL